MGYLTKLDRNFFENDPPLVGPEAEEKMCLKTEFIDATGSTAVKVWDKPCQELFGRTAARMRELWEEGVDHIDKQDELLNELNANMASELTLNCSISLWSYGWKEVRSVLQINVNQLEICGDAERT